MISVCICTYNREKMLRRTLASLAAQNDNIGISEVLIIDNNCSDGTVNVVEEFQERLPIRRVIESQQGLAHARNRAVAEFRGDVLLFTDDDVSFGTGWLAAYQDAIRRFPEADYFGGRILPDWGQAKPRWIGDGPSPLIDGVLVWFDHGAETRLFSATEPLPFGASFAIRRRLFNNIGLFRVDLGVGGMGLGRGEETEFLIRARDAGAQGVYVGEALCFHAYDPKRLTLAALYRHGIACGRSSHAIGRSRYAIVGPSPHGTYGRAGRAAWFVVRGMVQMLKGRGDRFRQCIINAGIEMGTRTSVVGDAF